MVNPISQKNGGKGREKKMRTQEKTATWSGEKKDLKGTRWTSPLEKRMPISTEASVNQEKEENSRSYQGRSGREIRWSRAASLWRGLSQQKNRGIFESSCRLKKGKIFKAKERGGSILSIPVAWGPKAWPKKTYEAELLRRFHTRTSLRR